MTILLPTVIYTTNDHLLALMGNHNTQLGFTIYTSEATEVLLYSFPDMTAL